MQAMGRTVCRMCRGTGMPDVPGRLEAAAFVVMLRAVDSLRVAASRCPAERHLVGAIRRAG